jgi:hypothetical protein
VKSVELVEVSVQPGEGGAFVAEVIWNVRGSVGHWGHIHERGNRYQATLEIAPEHDRWKLVGLEVLDEQRL